ncbi:hypothetical protein ACWD0A_09920 [Streptomyces sp. NPDC002867]
MVSNAPGNQRLYKLSLDFSVQYGTLAAPPGSGHIGAPTFDTQRGVVYVPIEQSEPPRIWKVSRELRTVGIVSMWGRSIGSPAPQRSKNPWLAFNPFDTLVYSSVFGSSDSAFQRVDHLWGYDRDNGRLVKEIPLPSGLHHVQGATFGGNDGRNLYIASDYEEASNGRKHVYAYDFSQPRDGVPPPYWGKIAVPDAGNEVECVVWAHLAWSDARDTHITVGILDDVEIDGENVYFRHFWVPSPERL